MPDEHKPTYRYRGAVQPCAEVSRPVAAYRTIAKDAEPDAPSTATLDIFDVVDSWGGWWGISANEVDRALKMIGDVDTLYVRINSPGGEATEGVAIANLLRAHKADVRVTVYGLAASAASVIAIAGNTVSMAPGSLLMVHEASGIEFGTAADMRAEAAALDAISDSYSTLYALKAGGDAAKWRETMRENAWYMPDAAVTAKLADRVGLDPDLPTDLPPVEDEEADVVVEIDVEVSPAALAAARRFDLSMLPNAPAALAATQAPAASADGSTETQEGSATVEFTDEQLTTMRQALGLPEDADAAAIVAAQAEALAETADPPPAPAPVAQVPDGKILVDKAQWDDVTEQAKLGAQARAKQLVDERDTVIAQAIADGKLSRNEDNLAKLRADWDADPETTRKRIADMAVLYPVKPLEGFQGDDGSTGGDAVFTDADADALAQLAGTTKEALING